MAQIKQVTTGQVYEVSQEPVWLEGVWECGNLRFTDPDKTAYEPQPPAQWIPLIGPIAFQMLFKVDELVAIDAVKETNAAIRIFWKLLDDPRTDYVDRNLEPIQSMLQSLEAGGLIGPGRAQEILHGEVAK